MKRLLTLCALTLFCTAASAELPSGKVADLLQAAEAGSLPAIYALAGGMEQVFPDSDDVLADRIDSQQIRPQVLQQLDPASATLAIGMMYYQAQTDDAQATGFYCRWVQRALALHQANPVPDEHPETALQWYGIADSFEAVVESLTAGQRAACNAAVQQWQLTGG